MSMRNLLEYRNIIETKLIILMIMLQMVNHLNIKQK